MLHETGSGATTKPTVHAEEESPDDDGHTHEQSNDNDEDFDNKEEGADNEEEGPDNENDEVEQTASLSLGRMVSLGRMTVPKTETEGRMQMVNERRKTPKLGNREGKENMSTPAATSLGCNPTGVK